MHHAPWLLAGLLLSALVATACGESAPPAPLITKARAPKPWIHRAPDQLTGGQAEQLARATAARDAVMGALQGELAQALAEGSVAGAVTACQISAPGLSTLVGRHADIKIGRTSHRLRNPANASPDWALPFVEVVSPLPTVLTHPDGRLAALLPIITADRCLQCHGSAHSLAPEVRARLKALYPADTAVDFDVGEIRGWFWVDVPPEP